MGDRTAALRLKSLFTVSRHFSFSFPPFLSAIRCYVCDNTGNPDTCELYPGSVSNGNKECVEGDFCYTSETTTFPEGEPASK